MPIAIPIGFALALTLAISCPAHAGVTVDGKSVTTSSGGTIVVRESDCRVLARHHPDADVAYTPGVDVKGQAVTPADLNPPLDLSERVRNFGFAVTVDIGDELGRHRAARSVDGEGFLGYVDIQGGVPYWNDKPLDRDGIDVVSAACDQALRKKQKDR